MIFLIKRIYRHFAALLSLGMAVLLLYTAYLQQALPEYFNVEQGGRLRLEHYGKYLSCSLASDEFPIDVYRAKGNSYRMSVKLMGAVPVKDVSVQVVDRHNVVPCGIPFGIKMFTDGVMVVGMGDIACEGKTQNPAEDAGIKIGDVVVEMNGKKELSNKEISKIVSQSGGKPITVTVQRDGCLRKSLLKPVKSSVDGSYKIGMWVRDSSAGIGTMTFYEQSSGVFGGLGHAICDADAQAVMPLSQGEAVCASITGIRRGEAGTPGELRGIFTHKGQLGTLYANNVSGVYGILEKLPEGTAELAVPVAFAYEVREGPATILTTVYGTQPQEYDVMIEKINHGQIEPAKNMIVRIVDDELIDKTGGIVQGMSGSPIMQNGRLVGAVTHVFVHDPTKGYGIFAENMIEAAA
ncbi:MAG: SpoIVB peptidase [Oscillospiraceae bacterium]|nr:SpoIVB peptidase [Oscillospiraceae bacterium]